MRLEKLDMLRGVAIVMMVIFHINYSLVSIFSNELLNFSEGFWYIFGKISVLLFITISGISFFLAHKKYGKKVYKKYFKYSLFLGLIAGLISFSTYHLFPEQYIRFGVLHFFALSFLLLPFFSRFKYFNLPLGIIIILSAIFTMQPIEYEYEYLYWLGFIYPEFTSGDYYPLLPYFGVLLLGYSLGLILDRYDMLDIFKKTGEKNKTEDILIYAGRKSLLIYLVHQPIIISVIFIVENIT